MNNKSVLKTKQAGYFFNLILICAVILFLPQAPAAASAEGKNAVKPNKHGSPCPEPERHKSGFIVKINKMIKSGAALTQTRYCRIKKEIEKLRERMNKRLEQINSKMEKLSRERSQINELLIDLKTSEAEFDKLKILAQALESAEANVEKSGTVEVKVR
ncbi:MAG TPA: hypothetical protein PKW98_13655 [Candidatus Wallbacteria bacterium]|nr:MAG: hypothetical protein BWY32_03622 [bacterium ADurb.Bin243]HPG58858.1 hypothetical protein [Candidatus Wallbacteria bacterium]